MLEADEAVHFNQQAEQNYKTAIQILKGKEGYEVSYASNRNNLGDFYRLRKQFEDAFFEYSESHRILEDASAGGELLGGAHGNIGVLYSQWAIAIGDEKQKSEYIRLAHKHKKEALKLTREAMGEVCFDTAQCYHNISVGYANLGEWERALPYAVRAATIPHAMLEQGVIDDTDHPTLRFLLKALASIVAALDWDPNEGAVLCREELPKVLADHAAWKSRASAESDLSDQERAEDLS